MKNEYDVVIWGGRVIDPAQNLDQVINIGISNGKIACLSQQQILGKEVVDASNCIVTPGFVDCHFHEDLYDEKEDVLERLISNTMLKMGVTTAIGGNCGIFPSDCPPTTYLEALKRHGTPINLGLLVPAILLREKAGQKDLYAPVSPEQLEAMKMMLAQQLRDGCIGLSLGLQYAPGTDNDELVGLMSIAAEEEKITAVHIRYDGASSIEAIKEILDAAMETKAQIEISHLGSMCGFGQIEEAISTIEMYKGTGANVGFDCYPYDAYCTTIGSACFDGDFLTSCGFSQNDYDRLQVVSGPNAGLFLSKESFDLIRKTEPEALLVAHLMNDKEVDRAILHQDCVIASDGIYVKGLGHPRGSGSFPRLIDQYVNKRNLMTIQEAIAKITWQPAVRFGLDKGTLKIGADADITIFNLDEIKDHASFINPTDQPAGIEYVFVNGKAALKKGKIADSCYGKLVCLE